MIATPTQRKAIAARLVFRFTGKVLETVVGARRATASESVKSASETPSSASCLRRPSTG